ncbi:MAG: hypothetical protein ACAH59_10180 [Pseudobdellovibrionaceae bacterium]
MNHPNFKFLLLSNLLLLIGCVNVDLKTESPTKSESYTFAEPAKPFQEMKDKQTDQAWLNPDTGNTIAVLSECSESRDPSLIALEGETIQALNSYQITESKELQFEARAARRSLAEGTVDGIPVKMDVLTFKKNSCAYTLTYVGRAKGFERDRSTFENFLRGFRVP